MDFFNGKAFYAFNIPGLQYYIVIYPNCDREERRGETWIELHLNGSDDRKIAAEFMMSIESAGFSKELDCIFEKCARHSFPIGKTDEFFDSKKKFFVDGEITIKIIGILKTQKSLIPKISSPISMQWKIKEEDLKAKKEEENGYLRSKRIKVGSFSGVKYYIKIYPLKVENEKQPKTILFLNIEMTRKKHIEAVYDFSIDSANFNRGCQNIFEESTGFKIFLCFTNDLFDPSEGYIVDGFLKINLNGILLIEDDQFVSLNLMEGVTSKGDKDFTIVVGVKEIKVNKQFLKDASPVFAGMLESGMKEATENKMIIDEKYFSFEIVNAVVALSYGQTVSQKFTLEDILSMYQFADKYFLKFVTDLIEYFLIKYLSPSNVVHLEKLSKTFNALKLHQSCIDFLIKCSKKSVAVLGSESLDKDFVASLFLSTLHPVVETDINF
uniref:BTB domain-containing protein n=1 Tax=Panagrolaimus sp. ES5 TaxID=591445 RepID=A0AC34GS77_9BILA